MVKLSDVSANIAVDTFSIHHLPYIRLPKRPNRYIFVLKIATAMFA
jgi:hypothetical protein